MKRNLNNIFMHVLSFGLALVLLMIHISIPIFSCSNNNKKEVVVVDSKSNKKQANEDELVRSVVIDAGHGGYDGGGVANGYVEKDVNLQFALLIGEELNHRGINVIYTRESDDWYWTDDNIEDLNRRVEIANESNAELFLSLHLNSSESSDVNGFEVWASLQNDKASQFAQLLLDYLEQLDYSVNRGIKNQDESSLHILEHNLIPSVLLELGFITSIYDMNKLGDKQIQINITNIVCDAIESYLNMK